MHYIAVENIAKDDYIYVHYDGKVFNGNEYPFALRDGVAKRDIYIGQYVAYDDGSETKDLSVKPIMPSIQEVLGR